MVLFSPSEIFFPGQAIKGMRCPSITHALQQSMDAGHLLHKMTSQDSNSTPHAYLNSVKMQPFSLFFQKHPFHIHHNA